MEEKAGHMRKVCSAMLMLTVAAASTADDILLLLAKHKHWTCNMLMLRVASYCLRYPETQRVCHIPWTTEVFTLSGYKAFLGKAYQKVVLFLCTEDYLSGLNRFWWFVLPFYMRGQPRTSFKPSEERLASDGKT